MLSTELESANRSLQQQVNSLQQDQTEVTQLLADFRAEQVAHSTLQAAHSALQVRRAMKLTVAPGVLLFFSRPEGAQLPDVQSSHRHIAKVMCSCLGLP